MFVNVKSSYDYLLKYIPLVRASWFSLIKAKVVCIYACVCVNLSYGEDVGL